jgi:hypothetical protein
MRITLLSSAAALALAFAAPALAQTPNNPLPANPSDVTNGSPAAGTPSGLPPGQDPSTTSHLTPSANAAPGSAPNAGGSSPAMGEGAVPADQGAAANPPSAQPPSSDSADQSAPPPAKHARKSHRMHSATASGDDSGHWAHEPGTGESGPASARASNIDSADTHSAIAPHLPAPQAGEGATPVRYLRDAERALEKRRTGEAQQALEMAETRLLDRSTPAADANQTDQRPAIQQVTNARKALASGDIQGARQAIQMALADRGHADNSGMDESGATNGMSSSSTATQTQTQTQAPAAPGGSGNAEAGHVIGAGTGGGPLGTPSQDSAGGAR